MVEAEALSRQSKQSEAVKVLEAAYQAHPDSGKVVIALSRMRWALGDREGSLKGVKDWLEVHPDDLPATVHLGSAYLSLGREQEATSAFEQALKLAPSDPVILNNLAWLSGKTNPARALEYAEKAYQTAPNNPGVIDTLGWLLVQQGNTKRGLELLQKASELIPDRPAVQYHYAAALAKTGEKALARRELERLLSSGKKFPEETEAKALLEQL
jgi:Flp pilus assembly protein TadD